MELLFDMGGVLIDLDMPGCVERFRALGFDIAPYLDTFAQRGFLSDFESGKISTDEFFDTIDRLGGRRFDRNELRTAWRAMLKAMPRERIELLVRASRHYGIHLLSNTNPLGWNSALELFDALGYRPDELFGRIFLSFELGIEKPAPAIFRKVVADLGCAPADILFFDDSATNCAAARGQGLRAVQAGLDGAWTNCFDADGRLVEPIPEA